MPNWCSNKLLIKPKSQSTDHLVQLQGDKGIEDYNKFISTLKDNEFKFSQIISMPKELEGIITGSTLFEGKIIHSWREGKNKEIIPLSDIELQSYEKFGCTNWYEFNTKHWGTKWDVDASYTDSNYEFTSYFDTAWSPPIRWALNVIKLFPNLEFNLYYSECGSPFYGERSIVNGVVINENNFDNVYQSIDDLNEDDKRVYDLLDNEEDPEEPIYTKQYLAFLELHGLGYGG